MKKIISAILAISAASAFHNFCLSLLADLLVPARRLRWDLLGLGFFVLLAVGSAAGAAKLWNRWRWMFGLSAILSGISTAVLMLANRSDPAPSFRDKAAAYGTAVLVAAVGAIVLLLERRRTPRR
jgi:hypothetical protein